MFTMTDKDKLEALADIGKVIEQNQDANGEVSKEVKSLVKIALGFIEECNESWCDNCGIIKATGKLCNEFLEH